MESNIDINTTPVQSEPPDGALKPPPAKRPKAIPSFSSNKQRKGQPPHKRFRSNRGISRHGGAAYDKSEPVNSISTGPRMPYFSVPTSTLGCLSFVASIYNWCVGKDYRFGYTVKLAEIQYVTVIAMIARFALVNEKVGKRIDEFTSRLKSASKSILLPDPICKMIECLGIVKRPGLPTCIPFFPPWERYIKRPYWYVNPLNLLRELDTGRPLPTTPWAIDTIVISRYIDHCARGQSRGLGFRTVNYEVMEGRHEMLWGYIKPVFAEQGTLQPAGPMAISQAEAELGAAYSWRRHREGHPWTLQTEGNHLVQPDFLGIQFDVPTFVAAIASEHLSQMD